MSFCWGRKEERSRFEQEVASHFNNSYNCSFPASGSISGLTESSFDRRRTHIVFLTFTAETFSLTSFYQPAMEDMETLNIRAHTHYWIVCSGGRRRSHCSQSMKVKTIQHFRASSFGSFPSARFLLSALKGESALFPFFFFVATESPLRVEVKQ